MTSPMKAGLTQESAIVELASDEAHRIQTSREPVTSYLALDEPASHQQSLNVSE